MYAWGGKQTEAGLGSAGQGRRVPERRRGKGRRGAQTHPGAGINPLDEWRKPDAGAIPTFGQIAD